MNDNAISVKQLNTYVKSLIEGDQRLSDVLVCGEISNFKNHYSSGHWYFTLKDNDAQIRCVMFRSFASLVPFEVQDGIRVVLRGRVSIYEKDGQYQFYAQQMNSDGQGDLAVAFNQLKERLQKEGLFDTAHKRTLKKFPKRIAVLTSDTGAAVRDIINITSKRYPICEILLCPVTVQGENAAKSIIDMLNRVYNISDIDTIIIGRGGGSIEDLWAFNNEELARKIYESPIPVISAVGHETDFTICDFVADVRASTPSHAAELAVPDTMSIVNSLSSYNSRLLNLLVSKYRLSKTRYELAVSKPYFVSPVSFFDNFSIKIDRLQDDILNKFKNKLFPLERHFYEVASRLDALSPLKTISNGYAAVSRDDKKIRGIADLNSGDSIKLRFADGEANCIVSELRSKL